MTMMQQQSESKNGAYVQPPLHDDAWCKHYLSLHVDSWYKEYVEAVKLEEDVERLMKKNKNMNVEKNAKWYTNYERDLNLFLISKRATKLWQILDRLDALARNPDLTRITIFSDQEQAHRQKLLKEERCKVMQLCMDFQDYRASRSKKMENVNTEPKEFERLISLDKFPANYYTNSVTEGDVLPQTQVEGLLSGNYNMHISLNNSGPSTVI